MNIDQDLQEAIEYFCGIEDETERSETIRTAWHEPHNQRGGELFRFLSPNGRGEHNGAFCGCPAQVKSGLEKSAWPELDKEIMDNASVPLVGARDEYAYWGNREVLTEFAKCQMRARELAKRDAGKVASNE